MLSHFEYVGITKSLEEAYRDAEEHAERHKIESDKEEQGEAYRRAEYLNYQYYRGLVEGLRISLGQVKLLKHS